jgi:hypothetical protein
VTELHTFQRLHRRMERQCQGNLQRTPFAFEPISFPNAAADLLCLATQSPIGLKRNASCWPRLGAKLKKRSSTQWKVLWPTWRGRCENDSRSFTTTKVAGTRTRTWHGCERSRKRSKSCKRRYRSRSILDWRIISSAAATTKRWNSWKIPSGAHRGEHRSLLVPASSDLEAE